MEVLLTVLLIIMIIVIVIFNFIGYTEIASTIYKGRYNYEKAFKYHSIAWRWAHKIYPKTIADYITGVGEFERMAD